MAKKKSDEKQHVPAPEHHGVTYLKGMYEDYFLDYASYVILERAVPDIKDGLKPVQRRIMQSMWDIQDGRFHKVANIIGHTMQYHPHGDAAIGDALVNLGQKELLIETQGNWGDIRTGDSAAAPRYIEARLTKFALDVAINPQTTPWQIDHMIGRPFVAFFPNRHMNNILANKDFFGHPAYDELTIPPESNDII